MDRRNAIKTLAAALVAPSALVSCPGDGVLNGACFTSKTIPVCEHHVWWVFLPVEEGPIHIECQDCGFRRETVNGEVIAVWSITSQ